MALPACRVATTCLLVLHYTSSACAADLAGSTTSLATLATGSRATGMIPDAEAADRKSLAVPSATAFAAALLRAPLTAGSTGDSSDAAASAAIAGATAQKAEGQRGACTMTVAAQMARLASGAYLQGGDIEGPPVVTWTGETMAACGWEMLFWECVPPCVEKQHDEFMVARNPSGNSAVPSGSCAVAFAGSDDEDEWDLEGGGYNRLVNRDWEAYRKGTAKQELELPGSFRNHSVYSGIVLEYGSITAGRRWNDWAEMARGAGCTELFFTGHSLGGSIAQVAWLDAADAMGNGKYGCTCYGKPCHLVPIAPSPIFFGTDVPELAAECCHTGKGALVYAQHDPVPMGDPVPVGAYPSRFAEMYGEAALATVNAVKGIPRIQLSGQACQPVQADEGCSVTTYKSFPLRGLDMEMGEVFGPLGKEIGLMLGFAPWHSDQYLIYMLDAVHLGLPDFFCSAQAVVGFVRGFVYRQQHKAGSKGNPVLEPSDGVESNHSWVEGARAESDGPAVTDLRRSFSLTAKSMRAPHIRPRLHAASIAADGVVKVVA